jgi:putative transposase
LFGESQRDSALKPRVARPYALPSEHRKVFPNRNAVAHTNDQPALRLVRISDRFPMRTFDIGNYSQCIHVSFMPQSLSAVYIHLVFSTKDRRPFLRDIPTRDSLHAFLSGVSDQMDCPSILVGGVEDHVHLLARFGRTLTQAEWVKELKRVSNRWLKDRSRDFADFEWQGGYASFSVSQSNLEKVKIYIAEQEKHHRKMRFQDELRILLRKHKVEWDEKYVWD